MCYQCVDWYNAGGQLIQYLQINDKWIDFLYNREYIVETALKKDIGNNVTYK